jgi:hypothetical protein
MARINQRAASCKSWLCDSDSEGATGEEIRTGSLQRIADAVETIAKDRVQMEADLKWQKEMRASLEATVARLRKSNAALRGCLRRAKNNAVRP